MEIILGSIVLGAMVILGAYLYNTVYLPAELKRQERNKKTNDEWQARLAEEKRIRLAIAKETQPPAVQKKSQQLRNPVEHERQVWQNQFQITKFDSMARQRLNQQELDQALRAIQKDHPTIAKLLKLANELSKERK